MRRSLLVIELFALAFSVWMFLATPHLKKSPLLIEQAFLFAIAFIPFIVFLPANSPLWYRRIYISLAVLATIVAEGYDFYSFTLYCTFLLKGCFLLPRKDAITIASIFMIVSSSIYIARVPEIIEGAVNIDVRLYLNPSRLITGYIASRFGNCIFVLLVGTIWRAEQKSRQKADRVTIVGSIISNGTMLEICDNGKGFSVDRPHAGFGLRNMKERVQCLGGNFNLDSEVGQGTRVKIFVPASS